jgi:hypothetical protein
VCVRGRGDESRRTILDGTASSQQASTAKPAVPSLSDLLDGWGAKLNGYVDATHTAQHDDTNKAPVDAFELRIEGRYDEPATVRGIQIVPKSYQGWLEGLYKF